MNTKKLEQKIQACKACPLHKVVCQKVIYRGTLPADIIFIGEAPGISENALGVPFVGPVGKLLDDMLASVDIKYQFAITNAIMCLPVQDSSSREPTKQEISACNPNLISIINLKRPLMIVTMGKVAKSAIPKHLITSLSKYGTKFLHLVHPSYILRKKAADRLAEKTRWELTLSEALEDAGLLIDPEETDQETTE